MTRPLLLRDGWVFDGTQFTVRQDVLLADGVIAAVGTGLRVSGAKVVECAGKTVMPGLIDAHVHLAWAGLEPPPTDVDSSRARARANAAALLAAGVTTVRDVGGPLEVLSSLRDVGPTVVHCGHLLCAPHGHGTEIPLDLPIAQQCSGPEGFAAAVREQLAGGASAVKVSLNGADGKVQLTTFELLAVVEEAHAAGARVAAHASVREAVALATSCGVDTIEHGNGLDHELAAVMAGKGIVLVPTVAIFEELTTQLATDTLLTEEQRVAHTCAAELRVREHGPALEAARAAGVTVALGTDRVPGGEVVAVHEELTALGRHGFTPDRVLRAATVGGAEALGLTDRGSIEVGKRADIVVLPGDLALSLDPIREPALVITAGTVRFASK